MLLELAFKPPLTIVNHFLLSFSLTSSLLFVPPGAVTALAMTHCAACDQSWLAIVYWDMHPINNMILQAGDGHDIQPLP